MTLIVRETVAVVSSPAPVRMRQQAADHSLRLRSIHRALPLSVEESAAIGRLEQSISSAFRVT